MQKYISYTLILLSVMLLTACEKDPNLRIDCGEYNSSDTKVTVNFKDVGSCPSTINVDAGQIQIEAHRTYSDGTYRHAEQSFTFAKNDVKKINLNMSKLHAGKNPVVIDKNNNLMWMKCSLGQGWNDTTGQCDGEASEHNWNNAMAIAESSTYAGFNDWRVPKIEELETLVYCSTGKKPRDKNGRLDGCNKGYSRPTINLTQFPNTPAYYFWSASPHANYADYAWNVLFFIGNSNNRNRSDGRGSLQHVRLVRFGQ